MFDDEFIGNMKVPNGFALAGIGVRSREVFRNDLIIYFRLHPNNIGFQAQIYQTGVVSGSHEKEFATGDTNERAGRRFFHKMEAILLDCPLKPVLWSITPGCRT